MSTTSCYVCRRSNLPFATPRALPDADALACTCDRCGVYEVEREFAEAGATSDFRESERVLLSGLVRRATDERGQLARRLDFDVCRELLAGEALPDAVEQADAMIDAISQRSTFGRFTPDEHFEAWAGRVFLPSAYEAGTLHLALQESGLLESRGNPGEKGIAYTLTLKGWERAREIRRRRGPGNQAFVAMWFHGDMTGAYEHGIAPALRETGYAPYRVDAAHHDNRIDDEIIKQIRRSRILVADATGARPSVYYEAGFAYGLGIPVLWCCNRNWTTYAIERAQLAPSMSGPPACATTTWPEQLAFDTSHHVYILWATPEELREKLAARIAGLGLNLPARASTVNGS